MPCSPFPVRQGAGKSTLLKCIIRVVKKSAGEITFHGEPLAALSQPELARRIGYVPQADGREIPFSVYDFVLMGRYAHMQRFRSPSAVDLQAVEEALFDTGMGSFRERKVNELSGGERQKVYIAAILAQSCELLLLDEPTTFLDPRHQAEVHNILCRVNKERGATIIMVTHDINAALLASDTILALKNGRLIYSGSSSSFAREDILFSVYDRVFLLLTHPVSGRKFVVAGDLAHGDP